MTCPTCGREAENGQPTHWLGCPEAMVKTTPGYGLGAGEATAELADACEHPGCSEPKASKSPRAKWCEAHKDPKNREK